MDENLSPRERLSPPPYDRQRASAGDGDRRVVSKPLRRRRGLFGRIVGAMLAVVVIAVAGTGVSLFVAYEHFSAGLPDVNGLLHYQPRQMSRVYAGDSRLLAELATERRIFVPYIAIPDLVKRAFLSAEDQNFFSHNGVDPIAILRAALTDISQYGQGRRPIGASTITQQVAKNMVLGNEVSLNRKIREAILAIRIEQTLSKDRILELYLNEIYLGIGSYGVAAAAQSYFNKSLDEVTLPEAAFLAALPKAPNNYNPFLFPDAARARRDWVLDRMADDHVITAEQATAAKATPIETSTFQRPDTVTGADYFAEEVRRQMIAKFGADETTQGGLVIRTSLDPALQQTADRVLREGLMKFDQAHGGWRGPVAHLDGGAAQLKTTWPVALSDVGRPPGMLPDWRLAVVLETTDREAKLGFIDRPPGAVGSAGVADPAPADQRILTMQLSDLAWARQAHDGKVVGGTPRRITDVLQVGDVVMAEPTRPPPAANGKPAAFTEKLMLRQIPTIQGAMAVVEPITGRVLALSGGWSFEMSQFNRASQALRQPGSSFKPFVYLTAMEQGISPSQKVLDAPFVKDMGAAGKWAPNNYDLKTNGPIPLRIALEKSLNLVTVRLADKIGIDNVAQTAIAFHEVDNMPRVLPTALGAVDTTVLRETAAYAGLAMGGKEVIPTLIDSVQDRDGHLIWRSPAFDCSNCDDPAAPPAIVDNRKQIADPQSTFQVVNMMEGVVARGTGYAAGKGLDRAIAGKTGTTQDFNDAWFSGFTPDLAAAVWIGYDNPTSLGKDDSGGVIAAPIWHDFMAVALKDRPNLKFIPPPGVTMASWDSGYGTVTDAFKPGQDPGASGPLIGGGDVEADNSGTAPPPTTHAAGVDTGLGGLY
jgi:penicillin-binding protein 1A